MRVRVMGLSQKMEKEPALLISDCRNDNSMAGPRINARMNGARSYSNFRKMYPRTPEPVKTNNSNGLEFIE